MREMIIILLAGILIQVYLLNEKGDSGEKAARELLFTGVLCLILVIAKIVVLILK